MFEKLRSIFSSRRNSDADKDWPSIVKLLLDPQLPTAEDAMEMAQATWGAAGPAQFVRAVGTHNFAIRVSPLTFALLLLVIKS